MGKSCKYCGKKIPKKKAIYVEGFPYCETCHSEAEIYIGVADGDDDADGEDDDDEDDDDDDDDDD